MKKNNPLFDPEVQEKRRKFLIEKCEKLGYIRIGVNEIKILDYIENFINYKIIRQFKVKAYSVDGYVKELNICLEVDERHHYDVFGNLKNKDIKRQKIIEESLKCQFIRIKDDELYGKIKENVLKKIIWIK
jgi:very-short-patch-repair endonuclease